MIVTIFRSRLQLQNGADFEVAGCMRTLAESMPEFLSFNTFYAEFQIQVCSIIRQYGFKRPTMNHPNAH